MKVLVIGGGGREHALVWKIAQSPKVDHIYCAPGNAGISRQATCVDISAENVPALLDFALNEGIGLTVVGPEGPLVAGLVNAFEEAGLRVFGPRREAAAIEGSKTLAKEIMLKYGIPTANFAAFDDPDKAREYIAQCGVPCVIKADGLAAGKGVVVAMDEETALAAVKSILEEKSFGEAGRHLVIEEFLEGEEVSILAFTDGEKIVPMVSAQDHKRVFDDDLGPNTGGMGAYSPAPVYTAEIQQVVESTILQATVDALAAEGRRYRGVIYAGLMLTSRGPKVLEYNARFGDPETQAVLARLETDLVEIMEAVLDGHLDTQEIRWSTEAAVCVVLASGGYPGSYLKGLPITGLDRLPDHCVAFHAGTAIKDDQLITSGGRVLGIAARGAGIAEAIANTYEAVEKVHFDGMHYRTDIGHRALIRG
ncbi:MAG: phosphoribosylamine--glycine ligase [Bacillota bacterium]